MALLSLKFIRLPAINDFGFFETEIGNCPVEQSHEGRNQGYQKQQLIFGQFAHIPHILVSQQQLVHHDNHQNIDYDDAHSCHKCFDKGILRPDSAAKHKAGLKKEIHAERKHKLLVGGKSRPIPRTIAHQTGK